MTPIIEAASWRIAAEICRRSPELRIRELHPGGGQYDCLAFLHPEEGVVSHLNRCGSFHVFARLDRSKIQDAPWALWNELVSQELRILVDEVSRRIGQSVPSRVPSSTPRVLVYRLIAAILSGNAFSKHRWTVRSAAHDSSGPAGCFIDPAVAVFSTPQELLLAEHESARFSAAANYWLVSRDDVPMLCLGEDGKAWGTANAEYDLSEIYLSERNLVVVIRRLFPDFPEL